MKQTSGIAKNSAMLMAMNIAKMIFPLLTLPYLTRVLSTDCYGSVVYVKSVTTYLQLLVDFGFVLSATKEIVRVRHDKAAQEKIMGDVLLARLWLAGAALVILVVLTAVLPILRARPLLSLLSFLPVFLTLFLFDFLFRGMERMEAIALRFVVMRGIATALTFVLIRSDADVLLIPLLDTASNDYELTRTGTMDWTKVDRILFVLSGKDMKKGVADHSMTVTYAAIADVGEQPDPVETVSMPTLFANKMMFQQNQPMKLWGSGNAGESVEVALYKQGETAALQTKTATVDADGSWSLELDGRAASYQKYNIAVSMKDAAGKVTKSRTLSDVLIGEVWVAAGQSNMALPVSNDLYADEYAAAADNDNIRLFLEPTYPTGEKTEQPLEPATDIPGAYWGTGADDGDVMAVSSVGYHFAVAMQKKLDVPFGLLYTPVGGSVIEAWIPRDAIDKDAEYKAFLKSRNKYCDENNWPAQGNRMSALYNQKIGALTGYHVAGTIWYQGESNQDEPDMYGHALTLMRDAWNEVFGYTTGTNDMPFVFTTVQPWITHLEDPQYLAYLAEGMYDGWKANEQRNMSMITLYDLPLYFLDRNGNSSDPIHPRDKKPVGERFATAAFNMVYNDTATEYTAPVYQSHKAVDLDGDGINDAIDVTFDHVGDGLQVINTAYTGAFEPRRRFGRDQRNGRSPRLRDCRYRRRVCGRQSKDHRQKHGAGLEQRTEKPRQCHL